MYVSFFFFSMVTDVCLNQRTHASTIPLPGPVKCMSSKRRLARRLTRDFSLARQVLNLEINV